jgi:hypothetical protein
MRRAVAIAVSTLFVVGCTGSPAGVTGSPSTGLPPAASAEATPTPIPTSTVPGGCGETPLGVGALPAWTASAGAPGSLPSVRSHEGNLVGVVFGHPLRAPAVSTGAQNKILWIVREARDGSDLVLTLRPRAGGEPVTVREPPNSGPGEIYPSIVDVPAAGCWDVVAEWDGHRASLELSYAPR